MAGRRHIGQTDGRSCRREVRLEPTLLEDGFDAATAAISAATARSPSSFISIKLMLGTRRRRNRDRLLLRPHESFSTLGRFTFAPS